MKKTAVALAALGLFTALGSVAGQAVAADGPWQVRARVVNINPADKSDPVGGAGAANRITVSDKTIPEVDISCFLTPNIAAELILTYPQKHDVRLDGNKVGTFKHLPPTLSLQYHFAPDRQFSPYVGAGINYTSIHKVRLGALGLEHKSVGLSFQAGADFKLDKNWVLNVDVKKVQIQSDVLLSGAKVSKVKVDPVLIGVGVGYRF